VHAGNAAFILLVPFIAAIIIGVIPGTNGKNRFGPTQFGGKASDAGWCCERRPVRALRGLAAHWAVRQEAGAVGWWKSSPGKV
jgi:hypothetical protein